MFLFLLSKRLRCQKSDKRFFGEVFVQIGRCGAKAVGVPTAEGQNAQDAKNFPKKESRRVSQGKL